MGTEQGILSLRKDTFVGKKENTISYTRKVVYPWEKDLMVYVMMGIMLILHFFMLIKQTLSLLDETITSNITFRKSNVTNNLYTDTTDVNTIMNPLHFTSLPEIEVEVSSEVDFICNEWTLKKKLTIEKY